MGIHCPEELEQKRQAIEIATESFVMHYVEGLFENNDKDLMYHYIESIGELIREYKLERTDA